jgi:hypothetical protein
MEKKEEKFVYEVSEEDIILASETWEKMADDKKTGNNMYMYLLNIASEYKKCEVTPIYIFDPELKKLYISWKEKYFNTIH